MRITYFDLPFWRIEISRLALHVGGVPFEDARISIAEFRERQAAGRYPLGQLPVLDVQGQRFGQSLAIARFCGRLGGVYPTDPLAALAVDELLETAGQISDLFVPSWNESDPRRKAEARAVIAARLPVWLERLEGRLEANGGVWFVGEGLTLADLAVWRLVDWLIGGSLDGIPTDLLETRRLLAAHQARVASSPRVASYRLD